MATIIGDEAFVTTYVLKRYSSEIFENKEIQRASNERLVSISFKNTGNDTVTLNDTYELAAGSAMITFESDHNCIDDTLYRLIFAGVGSTPKVDVWKTIVADIKVERVKINTIEKAQ